VARTIARACWQRAASTCFFGLAVRVVVVTQRRTVDGDTPSAAAHSFVGAPRSRIAFIACFRIGAGSGSSDLVFLPRVLGSFALPDAYSPTTVSIRSIASTRIVSASFSALSRSFSASRAASCSGFAGLPAGFGVIASIIAAITRWKMVWKWLRDKSSERAAPATVCCWASTATISEKRRRVCGSSGSCGAGVYVGALSLAIVYVVARGVGAREFSFPALGAALAPSELGVEAVAGVAEDDDFALGFVLIEERQLLRPACVEGVVVFAGRPRCVFTGRFGLRELVLELLDPMVQSRRVRARVAVRSRRQREQHCVEGLGLELIVEAARNPGVLDRARHRLLARQHRQHQQHSVPRDRVQVGALRQPPRCRPTPTFPR